MLTPDKKRHLRCRLGSAHASSPGSWSSRDTRSVPLKPAWCSGRGRCGGMSSCHGLEAPSAQQVMKVEQVQGSPGGFAP